MESVCLRGGGQGRLQVETGQRARPEVDGGGSTRQAGAGRQDPGGTRGALQQREGCAGVLQMLDQGHRHERIRVRGRAGQPEVPEHVAEDEDQRLRQQNQTVAEVAR
eukprot:2347068-Amphidinium_carterae.1